MQLTNFLCRLSNHLKFHHIPGDILIGKHRVWPKLTPKYKRYLLRRIDIEINNMKLISIPYINEEESRKAYNKIEKELEEKRQLELLENRRANKRKLEDRLMNEHLEPLRYHRNFE